jgi:hypothetical protein
MDVVGAIIECLLTDRAIGTDGAHFLVHRLVAESRGSTDVPNDVKAAMLPEFNIELPRPGLVTFSHFE